MTRRGGGRRPSPRLVFLLIAAALPGAAAPAPHVETSVVERVNEIRRARGLAPLTTDRALTDLARDHSCRMARDEAFGHGSFGDRVRAAGIGYRAIGENLARIANGPDPVDRAVNGWMKSEGHRANILSADFRATGVGVCRRDDAYYFTQLFVRPP